MLYLTLISLTLLSASSLSRGVVSNDAAGPSVPLTTNAKRLAAGLSPLPPYKKPAARTKAIGRSVVPLNTNAQRLAVGLPPLPQNVASRARTAKRNHPSPCSNSGHVRVRHHKGSVVGHISRHLNHGSYSVDDRSRAATIQFTSASTGTSSQLELKDSTNDRGFTPYIGFAVASLSSRKDPSSSDTFFRTLTTSEAKYAVLLGTSHTAPSASFLYSTLETTGFDASPEAHDVESAIWTYDRASKEITAEWVNRDRTRVPAVIYYNPVDGGTIALATDDSEYVKENPEAYPVDLDLV